MTPVVPLVALVGFFAALSVKHVLADFFWQPEWMALGKERPSKWARPLLLHCLVHGSATTALILVTEPRLWFLGTVDALVHLMVDRCKGLVGTALALTPEDRTFWAVLGIDQAFHHLTGFGLALLLAAAA